MSRWPVAVVLPMREQVMSGKAGAVALTVAEFGRASRFREQALVLGGTLDAPREVEPGEWRSTRIVGGKTYEIAKGDLIVVPRGTPHQRSTAGKDFTMILIKVFAERRKS